MDKALFTPGHANNQHSQDPPGELASQRQAQQPGHQDSSEQVHLTAGSASPGESRPQADEGNTGEDPRNPVGLVREHKLEKQDGQKPDQDNIESIAMIPQSASAIQDKMNSQKLSGREEMKENHLELAQIKNSSSVEVSNSKLSCQQQNMPRLAAAGGGGSQTLLADNIAVLDGQLQKNKKLVMSLSPPETPSKDEAPVFLKSDLPMHLKTGAGPPRNSEGQIKSKIAMLSKNTISPDEATSLATVPTVPHPDLNQATAQRIQRVGTASSRKEKAILVLPKKALIECETMKKKIMAEDQVNFNFPSNNATAHHFSSSNKPRYNEGDQIAGLQDQESTYPQDGVRHRQGEPGSAGNQRSGLAGSIYQTPNKQAGIELKIAAQSGKKEENKQVKLPAEMPEVSSAQKHRPCVVIGRDSSLVVQQLSHKSPNTCTKIGEKEEFCATLEEASFPKTAIKSKEPQFDIRTPDKIQNNTSEDQSCASYQNSQVMHSEPTPVVVRDGKGGTVSQSFSASQHIESSRHSLAKTIEEEDGRQEEDQSIGEEEASGGEGDDIKRKDSSQSEGAVENIDSEGSSSEEITKQETPSDDQLRNATADSSEQRTSSQKGEGNSSLVRPTSLATTPAAGGTTPVMVPQQQPAQKPASVPASNNSGNDAPPAGWLEEDIEQSLRRLLDLADAQIYDLHLILQILRRKYNKNYLQTLGQFKIKQKEEQRTPQPLPKIFTKLANPLRKIEAPKYRITLQEKPRSYPVKYEVDTSDASNFAELPPQTTAKAFSIFDAKKMTVLQSKNADQRLEIASMTKIMTAYTVCKIMFGDMQSVNINPKKVFMRASYIASKINGTTAHIKEGLRYSIYDLLIGLMLPSGNDAALVLAENFGRFLTIESCRNSTNTLKETCESDPYEAESSKRHIARFVKRMNQEAAKLKLINSSFSNPHGLSDKANKSSAQDIIRLTYVALKYPIICEIIKQYHFQSSSIFDWSPRRPLGERGCLVFQHWYNLNILLNDPFGRYKGVKTGQTPNAGSCLCTLYEDTKKGNRFIVVVIGTNTNKHRFQETSKLINWCLGQTMKQQMQKNNQLPNQQQFSNNLRSQAAGLSGLAKVGNSVMMNMNMMSSCGGGNFPKPNLPMLTNSQSGNNQRGNQSQMKTAAAALSKSEAKAKYLRGNSIQKIQTIQQDGTSNDLTDKDKKSKPKSKPATTSDLIAATSGMGTALMEKSQRPPDTYEPGTKVGTSANTSVLLTNGNISTVATTTGAGVQIPTGTSQQAGFALQNYPQFTPNSYIGTDTYKSGHPLQPQQPKGTMEYRKQNPRNSQMQQQQEAYLIAASTTTQQQQPYFHHQANTQYNKSFTQNPNSQGLFPHMNSSRTSPQVPPPYSQQQRKSKLAEVSMAVLTDEKISHSNLKQQHHYIQAQQQAQLQAQQQASAQVQQLKQQQLYQHQQQLLSQQQSKQQPLLQQQPQIPSHQPPQPLNYAQQQVFKQAQIAVQNYQQQKMNSVATNEKAGQQKMFDRPSSLHVQDMKGQGELGRSSSIQKQAADLKGAHHSSYHYQQQQQPQQQPHKAITSQLADVKQAVRCSGAASQISSTSLGTHTRGGSSKPFGAQPQPSSPNYKQQIAARRVGFGYGRFNPNYF